MIPRLNPLRTQAPDLRAAIRLGVEHICHGAVDRRRGCLPLVRFGLTEAPAWARHEYWGAPHMVGRFLDALAVSTAVLGTEPDMEVVEALRVLLHDCLDNPTGFAFDALPDPEGRRQATMHHCREVLLALTGLLRWRGCERSGELAHRLVRRVEEVTRATGTFPAAARLEHDWDWKSSDPVSANQHSGRLIGALVKYHRVTRDPVALDLAVRFARHILATAFTPDGELKAAAGTHLHSTEGTVTAIIDLGHLLGNAAYVEAGRQLTNVGLKPWRTSFGWAKEDRNDGPGRGEANNTGDFIEAALLLGRFGIRTAFGDAERYLRNELLACQIVNTDWIPESDGTPDTPDVIYNGVRARARGAFAFTTPTEYHSYNTDLVGGAVQSLCEAYEAIVTREQGGLHVNLLFPYDGPDLSVASALPEVGRLEITMHSREPLFVRRPDWADPAAVTVCRNGRTAAPLQLPGEWFFGRLEPGDVVDISIPQTRHQETETAAGYSEPYRVHWCGDTVMAIEPAAETVGLY